MVRRQGVSSSAVPVTIDVVVGRMAPGPVQQWGARACIVNGTCMLLWALYVCMYNRTRTNAAVLFSHHKGKQSPQQWQLVANGCVHGCLYWWSYLLCVFVCARMNEGRKEGGTRKKCRCMMMRKQEEEGEMRNGSKEGDLSVRVVCHGQGVGRKRGEEEGKD